MSWKPWWQETWAIVALWLFMPLGLFLMWRYATWSARWKWSVTGGLAALVVAFVLGAEFRGGDTAQTTPVAIDEDPQRVEEQRDTSSGPVHGDVICIDYCETPGPPSGTPLATPTPYFPPRNPDGSIVYPDSDSAKRFKTAEVARVIDGDTIEVRMDGELFKVRYIGIDTPETKDPRVDVECFGLEAAAANERLVEGQAVFLEKDVSETDRYGRLLRYVWSRSVLVNEELVADGYAVVSTYPPDVQYQDRFLAAQRSARGAGRGLWGACAR